VEELAAYIKRFTLASLAAISIFKIRDIYVIVMTGSFDRGTDPKAA
jgi:hypothetical protein